MQVLPFEREVEASRAHDRLRMKRRLAAADVDVVAVEGDVERPQRDLRAGELPDQRSQPLGDGDAPRVDADEGDLLEVGVALDDLVGDAMERAVERLRVEQYALGRRCLRRVRHSTPFRPHWTGLKGYVARAE